MSALKVPLRFRRREVPKPWGGRSLERCPGIALSEPGAIGETWEVVDRPGEESVVDGGPHDGRRLRELVVEHEQDLLGRDRPTAKGRFPLLVKYIDAQENLSVQVHPDDESQRRVDGAEAKTEAWYFLDVRGDGPPLGERGDPPGVLYAGPREGTTPERFAPDAGGERVLDHLDVWRPRPGECLVVPGGTVHAIGGGVTLLEVQQNSDTTYRMWDWGRVGDDGRPRATHLAEALAVTRYDLPPRPPVAPVFEEAGGLLRAPLARTRWFALDALALERDARLSTGGGFRIYAAVEGGGALTVRGEAPVTVRRGDVWLVPAAAGYHDVEPEAGGLRLVRIATRG